jgi:hypothetical protein
MPNSSPSKLALWMEYSSADLDKKNPAYTSVFLYRILMSFSRENGSIKDFLNRIRPIVGLVKPQPKVESAHRR